ncbi:hypothetical protein CLPU_10c01100 [Gottschalkia purinilytica]|uniref:VCBS repeat-containing protein n=1 Tax=Gottschalkia purinilytica TaxID=1503 RepID=A0A0L0W9S7_GOTPU|nr:hypothetical protein [Gottschalkia purinilytica]KNF08055.1 hypothetical protein CLPU_10c01100 [Gottschalkia purinilytica]
MFIGDFTGDKINDLFISASIAGNGGIINNRIVKLSEKKPKIIFSEKENEGIKIQGDYLDNFRVKLYTNTNKQFEIDLSFNENTYIKNKIYDNNGKLLKQVKTWSDSFQNLKPVDYDGDGIYELVGNQSIFETSHVDKISHLNSLWKYESNKWQPKEIEYSSFLIKQPIS